MPDLPIHDDAGNVPVFDCHILMTGPDGNGELRGIVSNLSEVTATARTERELLRRLADAFKSRLLEYRAANQEIPWEPKKAPSDGQQQRWIPVHL